MCGLNGFEIYVVLGVDVVGEVLSDCVLKKKRSFEGWWSGFVGGWWIGGGWSILILKFVIVMCCIFCLYIIKVKNYCYL